MVFWGESHDWDQVRELCPDCEFHCPDILTPTSDLSPKAWSEWIFDFHTWCHERVSGPSFLMGYSLGGRLALHGLIQGGFPWKGALLISSNPTSLSESDGRSRWERDQEWAEKFLSEPWEESLSAWNQQKIFAKDRERPHREEGVFSKNYLAEALFHWSPAKQNLDHYHLMALNTPTLWVAGEDDEKYSQIYQSLAQMGVPGWFKLCPEAGHGVIFDQPQFIAQQFKILVDLAEVDI